MDDPVGTYTPVQRRMAAIYIAGDVFFTDFPASELVRKLLGVRRRLP